MKRLILSAIAAVASLVVFGANRTNVIEGVTIVIYDEPGNYQFVPDEDIASAELLVVGGGGSGGGITGGGGGGGQVVEIASQSLTEGTAYDIAVGAGGASANSGNGNRGGDSSFVNESEEVSFTAAGGGAGSGGWAVYPVGNALDGGNGGGRGGNSASEYQPGGSPTVPGGHYGGSSGGYAAGGGGGAAEDGYDSTNGTAKAHCGGAGITNNITGTWVMYGYGGGGKIGKGGANNGYGDSAYSSGGINYAATAGENGTGGGGGGGTSDMKDSGAGGSGTVIIRYASSKKMPAEFDLVGFTGWADGEDHSVTVTPIWPSEYTIEYSLNGTDSFSSVKPQISAAGSNEVFVAMSGPSCTRTVKSAVVWLVEPDGLLLNTYTTPGAHAFTATARLMADVLVVGGGGSGSSYGGGGGGGFVIYRTGLIIPAGAVCSIDVGDGGASVTGSWNGKSGENSCFAIPTLDLELLAPGGGYGGGGWSNSVGGNGGNGGGAGGNGSTDKSKFYAGGSATAVGGHKGGDMLGTEQGKGAGGGGMAEDGKSCAEGGDGGAGWVIDITGEEVMYGAGGGGTPSGKGGTGDGSGNAATGSNHGVAGNPNTGCGGGGAWNMGTSGAGGSGIVVVRYCYLDAVPPTIDDSLQGHIYEDNHLGITGMISYLGSGASSCTVRYYLGTDPDALSLVGSDVITENGASFSYNATGLSQDTVYYWKVTAEANTSSLSESTTRRVRSCGKWHFEDGIIDDGVWAFNAEADGEGKVTVGAWTRYPAVASTLDFSKEITDGTAAEYSFASLNPQFSTIKPASSYANLGDCESTLAAPYVAELRLPEDGVTVIDKAAFAHCSSLTNVVPFLPDSVTELAVSAFLAVPAAQDVTLKGIVNVRNNVFHDAGVTSVTFGPGLHALAGQSGWGCFQSCANLTNLTFDSGMSGAEFTGEGAQFTGCSKLKEVDLSGFAVLNAANGQAPFRSSGVTNMIIGADVSNINKLFFQETSVVNVYFEGLPPPTFGTPILASNQKTRTITCWVQQQHLNVSNTADKCWLDYAHDGVINSEDSYFDEAYLDTENSNVNYKITDPAVRRLLVIRRPSGFVIIVR